MADLLSYVHGFVKNDHDALKIIDNWLYKYSILETKLNKLFQEVRTLIKVTKGRESDQIFRFFYIVLLIISSDNNRKLESLLKKVFNDPKLEKYRQYLIKHLLPHLYVSSTKSLGKVVNIGYPYPSPQIDQDISMVEQVILDKDNFRIINPQNYSLNYKNENLILFSDTSIIRNRINKLQIEIDNFNSKNSTVVHLNYCYSEPELIYCKDHQFVIYNSNMTNTYYSGLVSLLFLRFCSKGISEIVSFKIVLIILSTFTSENFLLPIKLRDASGTIYCINSVTDNPNC